MSWEGTAQPPGTTDAGRRRTDARSTTTTITQTPPLPDEPRSPGRGGLRWGIDPGSRASLAAQASEV